MAGVLKFLRIIRNNWKKSVVGTAVLSYGINQSIEYYETGQLMRQYCEDAMKYGDAPLPTGVKPQHVTIILNPVASKRKAKKLFEKYCEPLLHLAGIAVTVIQTESEGQARSLVMNLNTPTDAIVVAGGDGTLLDVVTGIMRKYNGDLTSVKNCPIGILPLGQINRVADSLFYGYDDLPDVREMADATMAVVRGTTKLVDVIEVEPLEQDPENIIKPIYTVGAIQWGAWRDAHARIDKYWYWGSLRRYVTYVFNGYKKDLNWNCIGTLHYSEPCDGCSHCYHHQQSTRESTQTERRWWHAFVPKINTTFSDTGVDYSKVINEKCGTLHKIPISTTELHIATSNVEREQSESVPSMKIQLGPENVKYTSFVTEGWKRENGNKITLIEQTLKAKDIELHLNPVRKDKEQMFSIDNEEFELKPVKIKLLPKSIKMFCRQSES